MTITFQNPGEIDIRGATIAGISAKASDLPIGFFGTGLKYAIAQLLARNGAITIYSGLTAHHFTASQLDFRGQQFQQIVLTTTSSGATSPPQPLGFTTEYGKTWEPWQIFRELYANALDEQGSVSAGQLPPAPGLTTIHITCGDVEELYPLRHTIILPPDHPWDAATPQLLITTTPSQHIYYRGVRVQTPDTPPSLTYNNLTGIKLTEDRTVASQWDLNYNIASGLQLSTSTTVIRKALQASIQQDAFEHMLSFSPHRDTSPEFYQVAHELYKLDPTQYSELKPFAEYQDPNCGRPAPIELRPLHAAMLARAIELVERMDHHPAAVSGGIHVADLGPTTLGMYHSASDTVYLSPGLFEQGTKQLVSCLLEELVHRELRFDDCTYSMQTYLFNRIVSLYEEHVIQQPL